MHTRSRLSDACATQLALAIPSAPSFTPSEGSQRATPSGKVAGKVAELRSWV